MQCDFILVIWNSYITTMISNFVTTFHSSREVIFFPVLSIPVVNITIPVTHRDITLHHCTHPLPICKHPQWVPHCLHRKEMRSWLINYAWQWLLLLCRHIRNMPPACRTLCTPTVSMTPTSNLATLTVEANHHTCLVAPTLRTSLLIPLAAKLFLKHRSHWQICVFYHFIYVLF